MEKEEKYQHYIKLLDAKMDALREKGTLQREKYRKIGIAITLLLLSVLLPYLYSLGKMLLRTAANF